MSEEENIIKNKENCYQATGEWCERTNNKKCKFDSKPCEILEEILRGN